MTTSRVNSVDWTLESWVMLGFVFITCVCVYICVCFVLFELGWVGFVCLFLLYAKFVHGYACAYQESRV